MAISLNIAPIEKYSKFGNMCDQFSINKMTIFTNIAPYKILDPLQTLFPSLKIAIFCRIVPRWNSWKFRHSKFFVPLQTLFPSLKIAIFCRIAPRSKSENPHASFSMCCARFFCYVSKRLDFFKPRGVAHNYSIRIRKSANVGHFYFNKRAILDKVAPRNSLCR